MIIPSLQRECGPADTWILDIYPPELGESSVVCLFVFLFISAPAAYGSSQTRGRIGATAAYATAAATPGLSHVSDQHHSLGQWDP